MYKHMYKNIFKQSKLTYLSAILHLSVFGFFLVFGYYVAKLIKPMPMMDSAYYWNLATDLSIYHKGGTIGFFLLPLKWIGLVPYQAAFIMNSFFLMLTAAAMWLGPINNRDYKKIVAQVFMTIGFAMFGYWSSAYSGIINADFTNVSLILIATRLFYEYLREPSKFIGILGAISLFFAISFRVKTGLALGLIIGFFILFYFKRLIQSKRLRSLILILSAVLIFAAGTELILRIQSDAKTDVQRQGRLQLYTGFLDTSVGPLCGRWTKTAYAHTLDELNLSLPEVFEKHLGDKSFKDVTDIIRCKMTAILAYDEFAFREIIPVGIQYREVVESDLKLIRKHEVIEENTVRAFKIAVYGGILLSIVLGFRRKNNFALLPLMIYASYLMLHAIFEIQARYMVEPLMWTYVVSILVTFGAYQARTTKQ